MNIGIAQMNMSWTTRENTKVICEIMRVYSHLDVLIFPELCVSGFHREITTSAEPCQVDEALQLIKQSCRDNQVAVFVGVPLTVGSKKFNSYLLIDEAGVTVCRWDKIGLTHSEARLFTPGSTRQVYQHGDLACSTLLCREVCDVDWFVEQINGKRLDYLVWASYLGLLNRPPAPGEEDYRGDASIIARRLSTTVIQCNWPQSLNNSYPDGYGGSVVIGPDGSPRLTLPFDRACVGLYNLESGKGEVQLL